MKCIDDEIPFDVPEGWEWCRLGNVVQHNTGKTLDKGRNTGKLFEYITTSNIYWECFELNTLKKMPIEESIVNRFTARKGDLLVCEGGDAGRSAVWEYERTICFQNHVHRVRPYLGIESWYIYFFLHKIYLSREMDKYKKGVGIQSISGDALASILLPLPSVKEQQRIISDIKQYNSLIETIDQTQEELHQVIKSAKSKILDLAIRGKLVPQDPNDEPASVLLKRIKAEHPERKKKVSKTSDNSHYAFDVPNNWVWCKFGNYIDVRDGTHDSPQYVNNGFPFVTSKNLIDGEIDFSNTRYISKKDHMNFNQRSFVENEDILFAMIGSIGNPVLVKKDREFSIKNVALFKPYSRECTYMKYVYFFLLHIQTSLKTQAKGGMQPFIPLNLFRQNLYIPVPPLLEQKRIVKKIEDIFTSIDEIASSIKA